MRITPLYRSLAKHLTELPENPSAQALLESVQTWLQESKPHWSPLTWKENRLERYLELTISLYPTEDSEMSAPEEAHILKHLQPRSEDSLAMVIDGLMWDGLTTSSHKACPRCEEPGMKILIHPATNSVVVVGCERCGWMETSQGLPLDSDTPLEPATREQLRIYQATAAADKPSNQHTPGPGLAQSDWGRNTASSCQGTRSTHNK